MCSNGADPGSALFANSLRIVRNNCIKRKVYAEQIWTRVVETLGYLLYLSCLNRLKCLERNCLSATVVCHCKWLQIFPALTLTSLLANSADDKLVIFFLFYPENRIWCFMQIVPIPGSGKKEKKSISICYLPKFPPKNATKLFPASGNFCRLLITFANSWTQIRSDKMSGLICIQIVWHSGGIPERFFWKS